jgi:hypothetical protein
MIEPGFYVDSNGKGHVFAEEVLEAVGLPVTDDNCRIVEQQLSRVFPSAERSVTVMQDGRPPDA